MSKEYLDREEVEKILKDLISDSHRIKRATIEQDIKYALNKLCQLKPKNQVIVAEGEIDNIKWESPYNKLVFYFKGLLKTIGIKIIKNRKVKIILEEES